MSLFDHLEALRRHLLRGLLWVGLALAATLLLQDPIFRIFARPHELTMEALGQPVELSQLAYQEAFLVNLRISLYLSLFLATPLLLRELWKFVSVGLYARERKYVERYTPLVLGAFVLGCLAGYFVMVPVALRFLAAYGERSLIVNRITLSQYLSLFLMLTLALGIVFELPFVMWALGKAGIVSAETFMKKRRHALLIGFVTAALMTPPDVMTQIMLAGPMYVLYEVGIMLVAGVKGTLQRGRFLLTVALVTIVGAAWLGWDLYKVDYYLSRLVEPAERVAPRPGEEELYEAHPGLAARRLLAAGERSVAPLVHRAEEQRELIPTAAWLVARLGAPEGPGRVLLRSALDSEDPFVRAQAVQGLAPLREAPDRGALETLSRSDPEPRVRVLACEALALREDPDGIFGLLRFFQDATPGAEPLARHAHAALVALAGQDHGAPGEPGAADRWWAWYQDTNAGMASRDSGVLLRLQEERLLRGEDGSLSRALAEDLLLSRDAEDRARAAMVVVRLGGEAGRDLVAGLTTDPDPYVRLAAGEALARGGDGRGIEILMAVLESGDRLAAPEASRVLEETTGRSLGADAGAWREWWQEAASSFPFR